MLRSFNKIKISRLKRLYHTGGNKFGRRRASLGWLLIGGTATTTAAGVYGYVYSQTVRDYVDEKFPVVHEYIDKFNEKTKQAQLPPIRAVVNPPSRELPPLKHKEKSSKSQPEALYAIVEDIPLDQNPVLTRHLRTAIDRAEKLTHNSTCSKMELIQATADHSNAIRRAIDAGTEGKWDDVVKCFRRLEELEKADKEYEANAKKAIAYLNQLIVHGRQSNDVAVNPLLNNASECAKKYKYQLDEIAKKQCSIDAERLITTEYAALTKQSRQQFIDEMRAILPNASHDSLSDVQMSALLAHAHLKVDKLQRDISLLKASEEKRIKELVAEKYASEMGKKAKNTKTSENPAPSIATSAKNTVPPDQASASTCITSTDHAVQTIKDDLYTKEQLKEQSRKLLVEYADKLEQVTRTQRQFFDIEKADAVTEAANKERQACDKKLTCAFSQLKSLEDAFRDRDAMDAEIFRSKQLWLDAQNLQNLVENGKKACCMQGRRAPLNAQLNKLVLNSAGDAFVSTVAQSFSKLTRISGTYTASDLQNRLKKVLDIGKRIARVDENNGSPAAYARSYVYSSLEWSRVLYSKHEKFDPLTISNSELIERAKEQRGKKDQLGVIKLLQQTKGPTRRHVNSWVQDARTYEESKLLTRALLAYSVMLSLRLQRVKLAQKTD